MSLFNVGLGIGVSVRVPFTASNLTIAGVVGAKGKAVAAMPSYTDGRPAGTRIHAYVAPGNTSPRMSWHFFRTSHNSIGVSLGEAAHADVLTLITSLRRAGIHADMAFGARGLKGAMKAADRSGADYALLIGTEERSNGTVRMKDLRSGDQQDVAAAAATDWLIDRLATEGLRDER